jgi:hypothetical protein
MTPQAWLVDKNSDLVVSENLYHRLKIKTGEAAQC